MGMCRGGSDVRQRIEAGTIYFILTAYLLNETTV